MKSCSVIGTGTLQAILKLETSGTMEMSFHNK